MYQREPEKNNWFHLDPQKLEQEEEQENPILDSDIDSTSEGLDESIDSATSGGWGF